MSMAVLVTFPQTGKISYGNFRLDKDHFTPSGYIRLKTNKDTIRKYYEKYPR